MRPNYLDSLIGQEGLKFSIGFDVQSLVFMAVAVFIAVFLAIALSKLLFKS